MKLPEFSSIPDAIALDLDGTLFGNSEQITPRNLIALNGCIEKGIPVILATSRPARGFHRVINKELSKRVSYSVMNGAVGFGNTPLTGSYKEPLHEDLSKTVLAIALREFPEVRITVEIDGFEFGANWSADEETLWRTNSATPDMVLPVEESILRQPSKIALGGIGTEILRLKELIDAEINNGLSVVPALMWHPMLNITNPGVSKSHALRKLLEPAGKSLDNVVAFGDDLPDMHMLTDCGYGVAMDNALDELKRVCPYCTAANDEDGVALVLERILNLFD